MLHSIASLLDENGTDEGLSFLAKKAESLLNSNIWPKYIGTAKYIPLSKSMSAFPKSDEIRTIAVLPSWAKVIELKILAKLNSYSENYLKKS